MSSPAALSAPAADLRRPPALSGHLALLVVQLCFGLFPVFVKFALLGLGPRAIAAWRIAVGTLVLGGLAALVARRAALPRRGDLPLFALCALLGVVANQVLALEGMSRSTAVNAGLIMTLIPVFTLGLAALFRQESLTRRRALGLPVAMSGALVLLMQGGATPELSRETALGNLLMAANCLSYAAYLLLSRRLLQRYSPLVVIAWVYGLSLWAVPWLLWGERLLPAAGPDQARAWQGLVLVLVFPTVLAYLLNTYALARVPASVTAIYIYLQPLIAAAGGMLFVGEHLPPAAILAALLLFTGIALVTWRPLGRAPAQPVRP
jgi:drug/metabolite transporter (DMT)-like permease